MPSAEDFGWSFAQRLNDAGQPVPAQTKLFKAPVPPDMLAEMEKAGIRQPRPASFWIGYNRWIVLHAGPKYPGSRGGGFGFGFGSEAHGG